MPILSSFGGGSVRGFNPGGSGPFDWGQFSDGDLYQGGYIQNINSSTLYWWFYPTQRGDGATNAGGNYTGTVTLEGATDIRFHVIGGGGGGSGANGSGGGGGGYAGTTGYVSLNKGQVISYQAGAPGLGGERDGIGTNVNWLGDTTSPNASTNAGTSQVYLGTSTGTAPLHLQATGGTKSTQSNPTGYTDCGQGGTGTVVRNTISAGTNVGNGGRGGSRNLVGESAGYGAGGGGGNDFTTGRKDQGGDSSFCGGGGGGAGNSNSVNDAAGGSGGTIGYDGGRGGNTNYNTFGIRGDDLYDSVSTSFPRGGGYAYQSSDNTLWGNTILGRGSAGGGGFPGGGGGSSYYGGGFYGDWGVGGDGASGAVMLQITY